MAFLFAVAGHRRAIRYLGDERDECDRRRPGGANPGPSWLVKGSGDFNDDGYADVLWQNTNGQAVVWEMNGANLIGGGLAGPNPGPSWQVISAGDFNFDGHSDILWQSTSGQATIWELNGTNLIGGGLAGPNPGSSWQAKGSGDFNSDGYSDILWQNTNGQAGDLGDERCKKNVSSAGGLAGPNPGPSWQVIGVGDFNNDGKSDILWQNTNGQAAIWEMDGTNLIGGRCGRSQPRAELAGEGGQAMSTATASRTSCGRTPAGRRRSGSLAGRT